MRRVQGVLEGLLKNERSFCTFEGPHDQTFVNSWNGFVWSSANDIRERDNGFDT